MQRTFDVSKEMERCRYSKMNDAAFETHKQVILENYIPTPGNSVMPVGDEIADGKPPTEPARKKVNYSKETVDKAVRYCTTQAAAGKDTDYKKILDIYAAGEEPG
jgi:hypothetical protein